MRHGAVAPKRTFQSKPVVGAEACKLAKMSKASIPYRYFDSSPEVIRLVLTPDLQHATLISAVGGGAWPERNRKSTLNVEGKLRHST
jgi:ABC-type taurine transport system substrate-binding protein